MGLIYFTSNQLVWQFVNKFDNFKPYTNRVKAVTKKGVFSLPINLLTINQFFSKNFSPTEAANFLKKQSIPIKNPRNFEEQALSLIGEDLYQHFFYGYTKKQWGVSPSELPASILKRLPVRFNYNDNYYSDVFQGIPENGYSYIVSKMLDHKNINVHLNQNICRKDLDGYDHIFYSGPIDAWFNYTLGTLGYRTLDFKMFREQGDYQGNAVINYTQSTVPFTRITEHKHFSPWESHNETIYFKSIRYVKKIYRITPQVGRIKNFLLNTTR